MYGERRAIRSIYSRAENQGEREGVQGKRKERERERGRERDRPTHGEGECRELQGKLAVGKKRMRELTESDWERVRRGEGGGHSDGRIY